MNPDTALGLSAELEFLLQSGWLQIREAERIRIVAPVDAISSKRFADDLKSEVWRIARFVAYPDFVSITRNGDGGYSIRSKIDSGGSFEILFEGPRSDSVS